MSKSPIVKAILKTGPALYGRSWRVSLARGLGVHFVTVSRWLSGTRTPAPTVFLDLLALAGRRRIEIEAAESELRDAIESHNESRP
jgi:hypothetical protein